MNNNQPIYSIQSEGVNYVGALLAYLFQVSGMNVKINLKDQPDTSYSPELSAICPTSYIQLPGAIKRRRDLLKLSTLTPHLFYPKRILMLSGNNNLQNVFDILTNREREACSLPVNLSKNKAYKELAPKFKSAVLVYEYQFDRNRATIELLKKAKKAGATISKGAAPATGTLKFTTESNTHTTFLIKSHKCPYPNDIRYSTPDFSIYFQRWNKGTRIGLILHNAVPNKEKLLSSIIELLLKIEVPVNDEVKNHFNDFIFNTNKKDLIAEHSLFDLPKQLRKLLKQASSLTNTYIRLSNALEKDAISPMNQSTFRYFQQQCDEKYDLAKQTGIDYSVFSHLYYRYPGYIDEMIEEAYGMMATTRDPEIITRHIEANVLESEKQYLFQK
ncbi:MAG: hypothetical protein K9G70_09535 [Prolixibacteraceae bacterium]|nr:hypothetical protein [Prolixibacteraceae bacterium]